VNRPVVLILGPDRGAVSGVSTHVNLLLDSTLGERFEMRHFQVGSEGRDESPLARLLRIVMSPVWLALAIRLRRVDVVHINTSLNPHAYWRDTSYLFVARLLRVRVVYQVHGGSGLQELCRRPALFTGFLKWTLSLPDVVVVLGKVEKDTYRHLIPDQEVVLVANGIDPRPFEDLPVERSSERDPLRLIYIGRVAREKGLHEVLQGMRWAVEEGVDAQLVIVGDGPDRHRLMRCAEQLDIADRVRFIGPKFGAEKVSTLAGADVMVLPSYSEGLPYALLEAMAAGIPVIATPVGAVPDVVVHRTHGHLVPIRNARAIADSLTALASDREQLFQMSQACRSRVAAEYSIERVAGQFAACYSPWSVVG
jgi:glycosyltransferase involved in cell wall biosynthesis